MSYLFIYSESFLFPILEKIIVISFKSERNYITENKQNLLGSASGHLYRSIAHFADMLIIVEIEWNFYYFFVNLEVK